MYFTHEAMLCYTPDRFINGLYIQMYLDQTNDSIAERIFGKNKYHHDGLEAAMNNKSMYLAMCVPR